MDFFPDLSWSQFLQCCSGDPRLQFEEMTRRLFVAEFLQGEELPQSETSHPGIEVDPILEPAHDNGAPRKRISFQSKFFDTSVGYGQIKDSSEEAAKHYKGKLDLIYLFCNLTLNPSRSSTYKDTVKLLNDVGIELKPISNGAVLDLLFKHEKIARYYFLPRKRTYSVGGKIHTTIIASSDGDDVQTVEELPNAASSVYHQLLNEKICHCRTLILDLNLTQLKAELDYLKNVENDSVLFYFFILELHNGNMKEAEEYKNKLKGSYRFDAEWLYAFVQAPREIGYQEILAHSSESQVILFNELLNRQWLKNLVKIHEDANFMELDDNVQKTLTFNYAIALFNLHHVNEAREELRRLYNKYHAPAFKFFYLCAEMQVKNIEYGFGTKEKAAELESCLKDLKEASSQVGHLYKNNERLVGMLEIQAYYNLSSIDESYLEGADNVFAGLSDVAKRDSHILYYYGMCYEVGNEFERALDIYSKPECDKDEVILYRWAICLLRLNRNDEVYERLNNSKSDNPGVVGARLAAEFRLGKEEYKDNLNKAISYYGTSLENLLPIAYHVEDDNVFNECIKTTLADRIEAELIKSDEERRIVLLLILIRHKQLDLILKVVKSGIDLGSIDGYIVHQLYNILIETTNNEQKKDKQSFLPSEDITLAEKIADTFIDSEAYLDRFLHVRLGCFSVQERHFAMLQDSKRLYDLTGDLGVARNIVALLYSQNEKKVEEYEPYLTALRHSDVPAHAIAVCSGAMRLGNSEMAERYAYKALYLLNGVDDYEIYRNYFSYVSGFVLKRPDRGSSNRVSDNMVVELQDNFNPDAMRVVCLDSEAEFNDDENHSLGVEHLKRGTADYTKIVRASIGQVLKVFGGHYRVRSFMPRAAYAFRFINGKIQDHPEKFDGVVYLVSTEEPQKMIEEIKKYTDRAEESKHILACYHFEATESGIPIEMLCHGDYSRYIDTMRMLLYGANQALYAGIAEVEQELKGPYVPTLSTLVLLNQIGHMKVLEAWRDKIGIIIPESYIEFFEEQFANSTNLMDISPGTLASGDDGNLLILENDKHIPEMWEEILEWCQQCNREDISTYERVEFSFAGVMTGDHLISAMNMNKIQLDALILAKKRKATYISDDLFMRKVATWAGIKNNNFTFLLYFLNDMDLAAEITLTLSKTNYIYTPIFTAGRQNTQTVINNLLTSERKKQLYGAMLENIRQTFLQAIGIAPDEGGNSSSNSM